MRSIKCAGALLATAALAVSLGCASTQTRQTTANYVDDSVITAKVKAAILGEPGLNVAEINVETFKGTVQLSGFVSSKDDIPQAIRVATAVDGVKSVKNGMQVKR